jgi:SAF domain
VHADVAVSTNAARSAAHGVARVPSKPGFRPSSRSRVRIAVGTLLALIAVGVVLLVFATADKRVPVLQVVHDVTAGAQLTADDLRSIEVSADPSLAVVKASDINQVIGRYAKVRIVSGGLLAAELLQASALVGPDSAVVAVTVAGGELPSGLRERSRVQVVMPGPAPAAAAAAIVGRIVGLPAADSVTGQRSVSLEVSVADAAVVASAAKVRLVLLDPGVDPTGNTP